VLPGDARSYPGMEFLPWPFSRSLRRGRQWGVPGGEVVAARGSSEGGGGGCPGGGQPGGAVPRATDPPGMVAVTPSVVTRG